MNIHLPAILMWTKGVHGFDTLPFVEDDPSLLLESVKAAMIVLPTGNKDKAAMLATGGCKLRKSLDTGFWHEF